MAKDNVMGAPTEGLGQNVTFAFNTGSPSQMPGATGTGLRVGQSGGNAMSSVGLYTPVVQEGSSFVRTLAAIGGKIVDQRMKEQQQVSFAKGAAQAMMGKAVDDIVADLPWYERLWGADDMVEGARAYNAQAKASSIAAGMASQMNDLRTKSPEEAAAMYGETMKNSLTGVEADDNALTMELAKVMPQVMRTQVKEHFLYQQERADVAQTEAIYQSGKNLQTLMSAQTSNEEESAAAKSLFVQNILPPNGQPDEVYARKIAGVAQVLAQAGDLHPLNVIRESGLFDALPYKYQIQITRAQEAGESQVRQHYSQDFNDDIFNLTAAATHKDPSVNLTTKEVLDQVDAFNAAYNKRTGSDRGYFSPAERAALGRQSLSAIAAARQQALTDRKASMRESSKEAQAEDDNRVMDESLESGFWKQVAATPGFTLEKVEERAAKKFQALPDQASQANWLWNNYRQDNGVLKRIANRLDGTFTRAISSADKDPAGVADVYGMWSQLYAKDPALAASYYPDSNKQLTAYHNAKAMEKLPDAVALQVALQPDAFKKVDDKALKSTSAVLAKEFNKSYVPDFMESDLLTGASLRVVSSHIARRVDRLASVSASDEDAIKISMKAAKSHGEFEVLGSYAWINTTKAQQDKPLAAYLQVQQGKNAGIDKDSLPHLLRDAINEAFVSKTASGALAGDLDDANTTVYRVPDKEGVPQLWVQRVIDGEIHDRLISANDVMTQAQAYKKRREDAKNNPWYRFGPKPAPGTLMGQKPEGQPNALTGTPEQWEAYRAKQQGK